MFCPQELFGITGYPLGHSLSPRLHNWGFAEVHHPGVFLPWPVEPGKVDAFVSAVRVLQIRGACVTIPHKEAVLPLLDRVSERARRMGAVNTLYWDGDALCGENTDVDGFTAPLRKPPHAERAFSCALVLGAGGAARAVVQGLKELGIQRIALCNRNADKAQELARHFDVEAIRWEARHALGADMVINTTPLGMLGKNVDASPFDAAAFLRAAPGSVPGCTPGLAPCLAPLAYDIVYNPLETRFLREAKAAGWATQDGLDMFVAQGLVQFKLWTGHDLPTAQARAVLLDALRG